MSYSTFLYRDASVRALENAAAEGSLVVCDLVYAELCIHFHAQGECDRFLHANEIRVEALNSEAHFLASRVWRAYRKQGGQRTRILADFLIGAHAGVRASRLLSRDRGFYRKLFPELSLIDPGDTQPGGAVGHLHAARSPNSDMAPGPKTP
jgi:predicted nucleic acid-binding protein